MESLHGKRFTLLQHSTTSGGASSLKHLSESGWRAEGEQTDGMLGFMVNTVRDLFETRAEESVNAVAAGLKDGETVANDAAKANDDVVPATVGSVWQAIIAADDVLGIGLSAETGTVGDEKVLQASKKRGEFVHTHEIREHKIAIPGTKKTFSVPGNRFSLPSPSWMVNGRLDGDFSDADDIKRRVRSGLDQLIEDHVREEGQKRHEERERRQGKEVEDMDDEELKKYEAAEQAYEKERTEERDADGNLLKPTVTKMLQGEVDLISLYKFAGAKNLVLEGFHEVISDDALLGGGESGGEEEAAEQAGGGGQQQGGGAGAKAKPEAKSAASASADAVSDKNFRTASLAIPDQLFFFHASETDPEPLEAEKRALAVAAVAERDAALAETIDNSTPRDETRKKDEKEGGRRAKKDGVAHLRKTSGSSNTTSVGEMPEVKGKFFHLLFAASESDLAMVDAFLARRSAGREHSRWQIVFASEKLWERYGQRFVCWSLRKFLDKKPTLVVGGVEGATTWEGLFATNQKKCSAKELATLREAHLSWGGEVLRRHQGETVRDSDTVVKGLWWCNGRILQGITSSTPISPHLITSIENLLPEPLPDLDSYSGSARATLEGVRLHLAKSYKPEEKLGGQSVHLAEQLPDDFVIPLTKNGAGVSKNPHYGVSQTQSGAKDRRPADAGGAPGAASNAPLHVTLLADPLGPHLQTSISFLRVLVEVFDASVTLLLKPEGFYDDDTRKPPILNYFRTVLEIPDSWRQEGWWTDLSGTSSEAVGASAGAYGCYWNKQVIMGNGGRQLAMTGFAGTRWRKCSGLWGGGRGRGATSRS